MAEKILVGYATKKGATAEIAERIAERLRAEGIDTEVREIKTVKDVSEYDRIVLGSALYMGFWRKDMVKFLKKQVNVLSGKPTWLFCSGPTDKGEPEALLEGRLYPDSLLPIIEAIQAEEITCFGGKLDPERLRFFDRKIIEIVKAPVGDFRDWGAIDAFADRIASIR